MQVEIGRLFYCIIASVGFFFFDLRLGEQNDNEAETSRWGGGNTLSNQEPYKKR